MTRRLSIRYGKTGGFFWDINGAAWEPVNGTDSAEKGWTGTVHLSDEMEPKWFLPEEIPFGEMWMADRVWLPMILKGNKIRGTIYFEKDGSTVYDYHFEMV
mgnify:CR=1 FL=1